MNGDNVSSNNWVTRPSAGDTPKIFSEPNHIYTIAIIARFIHAAATSAWSLFLLIVTISTNLLEALKIKNDISHAIEPRLHLPA
jgi:hypothetical protein